MNRQVGRATAPGPGHAEAGPLPQLGICCNWSPMAAILVAQRGSEA